MTLPKNKNFSEYDNYLTDADPTTAAQAQDYFKNQADLLKAVINSGYWQPETKYAFGAVVKSDSMPSGTEAICVAENGGLSSGVEPSWGEVGGANVSDGTCFWKLRWKHWSKDVIPMENLGLEFATQAEAEAGTNNESVMTPLRVKQGMLKNPAKGINVSKLSLAGNRTIADLRNEIEWWLNSNNFSTGVAAFESDGSFVDAWNNEDLTHSLPDASWWHVHILGSYYDAGYTQLLITSYINKEIYIVHKAGNEWGKIHKLATNGALSMPSVNHIDIDTTLTEYVAPADGWLLVEVGHVDGKIEGGVINWATDIHSYISANAWNFECSVPISRGQVGGPIVYTGMVHKFRFVYAQSEG